MQSKEFEISDLEVDLFVGFSRDSSKIHANSHFAQLNGYSDRVVHGAYFLVSLLLWIPELLTHRFTARADFFYPIIVNQKYVASLSAKEAGRITFEVSKSDVVFLRISIETTLKFTDFPQSIVFDMKCLLNNSLSVVSKSLQDEVLEAIFEMSRYVGMTKPGNNAILRRVEMVKDAGSEIGQAVSSSESFENQIYLREVQHENGNLKSYALARDFETIDSKKEWINSLAPQVTRETEFAVVTGALGKLGLTSAIMLSHLGFSVIGIIRSHDSTSNAVSSELAALNLGIEFQELDEFIGNLSSFPKDKITVFVHCSSPRITANFEMFDRAYYLELNKVFSDQMEELLLKLVYINHLVVPSTTYLNSESIPGYLEYIAAKKMQEVTAETFRRKRRGVALYMPRLAPFKSRHSQLTAGNDDSAVREFAYGLSKFVCEI